MNKEKWLITCSLRSLTFDFSFSKEACKAWISCCICWSSSSFRFRTAWTCIASQKQMHILSRLTGRSDQLVNINTSQCSDCKASLCCSGQMVPRYRQFFVNIPICLYPGNTLLLAHEPTFIVVNPYVTQSARSDLKWVQLSLLQGFLHDLFLLPPAALPSAKSHFSSVVEFHMLLLLCNTQEIWSRRKCANLASYKWLPLQPVIRNTSQFL